LYKEFLLLHQISFNVLDMQIGPIDINKPSESEIFKGIDALNFSIRRLFYT